MLRFVRSFRVVLLVGLAMFATHLALKSGSGGVWKGPGAAHAVAGEQASQDYDLTQLRAVNETLNKIRTKYVEPSRVNPKQMFISALNQVQREVAQVIVTHDDGAPDVKVRVGTEEKRFRVDTVQGPWDVSARLREVFQFLQVHLQDRDVKLQEVEYAACNGMLQTLDPHSVFLDPEAVEEMTVSTTGHFGGLGIVISIRDLVMTVMRPMPGTPAVRAGLKRLDRILKINNESTTNMPLSDAVQRLRGEPGSKVKIWIHREGKAGWTGMKPFVLQRERIQVDSVQYQDLGKGVGYVQLKNFQETTDRELSNALSQMRKRGPIKGLVMDLRSNPGGLLDQALRIANRFLARGVIVSTVGFSEERDEKRARREGTEPEYPIVILVNGSSASASEIVSGALKNHGRAVVIGQTTFGKGSVQLVYRGVAGNAALKLTIAQYLTPGDISIQGVGVTPDIELDPMTADILEMDLFRSEKRFSERDLRKSLSHSAKRSNDRPWMTLRYNLPESERKELRELGGQMRDEFYLDFTVRFARDLVANLTGGQKRAVQLEAARGYIESEQQQQLGALSQDLKQLNIDWSSPPSDHKGPKAEDFNVVVSTDQPDHTAEAGGKMTLRVAVTNNGKTPVYQLRAVTKSDSSYYDEREVVFGRVAPGKTVSASVPFGFCEIEGKKPGSTKKVSEDARRVCTLPEHSVTRQDVVKVRFSAEGSDAPTNVEIRPTVTALPQPSFSYTYQVADDRFGNGDGQLQKGEKVTLYLDVKNIGEGSSLETQALLRNLSGDGLLLRAGRFDISNMKPGATRRVAFTFDVLPSHNGDSVKVDLSVVDRDLRVSASEKLTIPIVSTGLKVETASGTLKVTRQARVTGKPLAGSSVLGLLEAGSIVNHTGSFGEYRRVGLGDGRFGFVLKDAVSATAGTPNQDYRPLMAHSPPELKVDTGQLATRGESVTVRAKASDNDGVLDTYIFHGVQKVFYQSNRKSKNSNAMQIEHVLPLNPGINTITVVTRENEDVASAETIVVRKDGPNGEALTTPKRQQFGEDWVFDQE